ncbi:MAG: inorganic phosphate transporter [Thermodesulfobacteriota bacterium]|nr:inorganic phosphate transporter [Thermodesulfobacteriota bacterium]
MTVFFLMSGVFLGWSLGANDAANVFGTAVGTRMLRFRVAAVYCSIFIILGAMVSGGGAAHTLGKLGAINAIGGAFVVAMSAGISVYLMTLLHNPVSTSQAIVGAIIGWNLFSGNPTDYTSLTRIVITWVACPILSGIIAVILYVFITFMIRHTRINMFQQDSLTRSGLILAGIFGSYALGANNIANVMGVFIPVAPFPDVMLFGCIRFSSTQQLFFVGGIAIAAGVITYSRRVMMTVGRGIFELTPVAAFVVVTAQGLVLFIFASQRLSDLLVSHGLPAIPLVPVSSSQAIVGAVMGIAFLKGIRAIQWKTIGRIAAGWAVTPLIAAVICFVSLFFMQNVFEVQTYKPVACIQDTQGSGVHGSDVQGSGVHSSEVHGSEVHCSEVQGFNDQGLDSCAGRD